MTDLEKRVDNLESKLGVISNIAFSPFEHSSEFKNDEIDLRVLWNTVWAGKWMIASFTLIFGVVSVVYALSLPNIYKSEALLAPAEDGSGGGLTSLAGQFGGLASLAGVSLGGGGDKTSLAIEVLRSRGFISKFIKRHDLLIPLMASKGWNQSNDELIINPKVYDGKWNRKPSAGRAAEPTMQEAYRVFMRQLSVVQDKKTNFVSIGFEFYSPKIAQQWVEWLVHDINEEIKIRDVLEAKKSVEYLSEQLKKTSITDMQTIFYELIEEQTKTIMFAEVRDEYVFKTIDEPIAPEIKFRPKRSLICLVAVFLGGVLGVLVVLVRHFIKSA